MQENWLECPKTTTQVEEKSAATSMDQSPKVTELSCSSVGGFGQGFTKLAKSFPKFVKESKNGS